MAVESQEVYEWINAGSLTWVSRSGHGQSPSRVRDACNHVIDPHVGASLSSSPSGFETYTCGAPTLIPIDHAS
jgi:hypothetical protein